MLNGSMPGIFAFDVENCNRRVRNSSAGKLLQLLQFLRDLSIVNAFNLFESAVVNYLKCCIREVLYQILLEKLFARFLFEYLMGYIQRGGWATYSDTSWEFRATYVSIELRLAAYFWFKFRAWPPEPSSSEGGRKRRRAELKGWPSVSQRKDKFEPRLKATVQNGNDRMVCVYLGGYDSRQEADMVYWIGAYYYNRWDRFSNGAPPRCMVSNLPPLPPNLSVEDKNTWVQRQAEVWLTTWRRRQDPGASVVHCQAGPVVSVMLSAAVAGESQEALDAEPHQGAGYDDPVTGPNTVDGGDLSPIDDFLQSPPPSPCGDIEYMRRVIMGDGLQQPDSTGIGIGFCGYEGTITTDDYNVGDCSTPSGEVLGQGGGSEGPNFQQSREVAVVLEGAGAAAEVVPMPQGATDLVHSASREFADHTNVADVPIDAHEQLNELRFTDEIQSTFDEFREQDLGFEMRPLDSNETFRVDFSKIASRKRPRLTHSNYFALKEIHKQGYKIILKPLSDATTQDATGRLRSGSSSQGLCASCNAPLSEIAE